MLRSIVYYLLAAPAFFLPFVYLCMLPATFLPSVIDVRIGMDAEPTLRQALWGTLKLGFVATLVQWPFYLAWAAMSREARPRIRVCWVILLFLGNMFAIPVFLYAKFRRNIEGILLGGVRNQKIRNYLNYETEPRTT